MILYFYASPARPQWTMISEQLYELLVSLASREPDFCEGCHLISLEVDPAIAQQIDLTAFPPLAGPLADL